MNANAWYNTALLNTYPTQPKLPNPCDRNLESDMLRCSILSKCGSSCGFSSQDLQETPIWIVEKHPQDDPHLDRIEQRNMSDSRFRSHGLGNLG